MEDAGPEDPDEWMQWRYCNAHANAGKSGTLPFRRYEFARYEVGALVAITLPGLSFSAFRPPQGPVSRRVVLFATDDDAALIVVVGAHEPAKEVEKVLPYALEHVGDRDLILLIPAGTEWPVLARLPWLHQHARVFTHAGDGVAVQQPIPLRSDVLEAFRSAPGLNVFKLTATHQGWADELIAWANGHPRLMASHRKSYLGWQVDGRLVLKINPAAGGRLRIAAGVQPGSDSPKASGLVVELDGPLMDPEPLREAVRHAMATRLTGDDRSHVEHRFQARLQMLEPRERLGLVTFLPEYPAQRPVPGGQGAGSIDFLGVDDDGRLHVVETKVGGSEPTVFLQALDYWIWVEANRAALADELDADPDLAARLSVVVLPGASGDVLHRQNRYIANRLHRSVPLTMWAAELDLEGALRLSQRPFWSIRASDRWVDRMRQRARSAALLSQGQPIASTDSPTEGIFDDSQAAAASLADEGYLHTHVHLPQSSQRFALDLFGSLDTAGAAELLAHHFGPMASAHHPEFEWVDEDDWLAEKTADRPHQTQVDVYLEGETTDGRSVALLVEVKLTEVEFGTCSHAEVAPDDARSVCAQDGPFGGEPAQCWQLRNRDTDHRRRYDEMLATASTDSINVDSGCWFRDRNQPMRLAALANALVHRGELDECRVVLTVPTGHTSIRRRWSEATAMFEGDLLDLLEPERVLGALEPEAQAFLIDRYGLGTPRPLSSLEPAGVLDAEE